MKPVIYNNKQLALHKFFYKGKSYVKVGLIDHSYNKIADITNKIFFLFFYYCSWIYRSHIYIEVANMDGQPNFTLFYYILTGPYFNYRKYSRICRPAYKPTPYVGRTIKVEKITQKTLWYQFYKLKSNWMVFNLKFLDLNNMPNQIFN